MLFHFTLFVSVYCFDVLKPSIMSDVYTNIVCEQVSFCRGEERSVAGKMKGEALFHQWPLWCGKGDHDGCCELTPKLH